MILKTANKEVAEEISENISIYLKSEQDHHDQLPGLFPPGAEKTSVTNAGGNWGDG